MAGRRREAGESTKPPEIHVPRKYRILRLFLELEDSNWAKPKIRDRASL